MSSRRVALYSQLYQSLPEERVTCALHTSFCCDSELRQYLLQQENFNFHGFALYMYNTSFIPYQSLAWPVTEVPGADVILKKLNAVGKHLGPDPIGTLSACHTHSLAPIKPKEKVAPAAAPEQGNLPCKNHILSCTLSKAWHAR